MRRLIAALVAALFLALPMVIAGHPADAAGGKSHGERKADRDRSVKEARDHIDRNDRLTNEQKARLRGHADTIEGEFAAIDKATDRVLALTAGGSSVTPEQKAEIEAEVREHLTRIGSSHAKLGALQRELTAEVQASPDLSPQQKAEVTDILQKVVEGKMSVEEARVSLTSTTGGFVMMGVLFVLMIIVGAG
jgi:uncharacterized protein (TIGR01732 family)